MNMKRNILGLSVPISDALSASVPNIHTYCATPPSSVSTDKQFFANHQNFPHFISPTRVPRSAGYVTSPSRSRSPNSKSLNYLSLSPSKGLDRFIASRSVNNFEYSSHHLTGESTASKNAKKESEMRKKSPMTEDMMTFKKVLHFSSPKRNSGSKAVSPRKSPGKARRLPASAENILDAPRLVNNFFSNSVDWGKSAYLAAALHDQIFLWDITTGETSELFESPLILNEVSGVKWSQDGKLLAAGTRTGQLHVREFFDEKLKYQGILTKHNEYVTALSWNKSYITSADALGFIHHSNVVDKSVVKVKNGDDIVCGLKWSPNGLFLLVGSSCGTVQLYRGFKKTVLKVTDFHTAAVKAMSWCPWSNRVFVTGGGLKDQKLRVWELQKTLNMTINDVTSHAEETGSQICDLVWPANRKEIITAHAHPDFKISFWSYPSLSLIGNLLGHVDRVLSLCLSPGDAFLVSVSADETIRLWDCFPEVSDEKRKQKSPLNKISIR